MNEEQSQAINYQNIASLKKYVLTKENKNSKELEEEVAIKWAKVSEGNIRETLRVET